MATKGTKTIILIDGNAIIHRAYHALPPLTSKKGELVNAVYGFSSTLLSVIDKFKPDYVAATFDLAGPTFRHNEYKEYKGTRIKADQELYNQIPRVKEVVKAFNIPIFEKEGFEADDMIGTIAEEITRKPGTKSVIVTGDLDSLQLIKDDKTVVYTMRRGLSDAILYDEKAVFERFGLKPEQLKDYKGLRGDASDNIPGVKGIGEKTAIELLKKYQSLENVYSSLDEIKGALKEKLEKGKADALLSKKLGTIKTDVSLEFDLEKCFLHEFDREKVVALFKELGFFSLIKRIPEKRLTRKEDVLIKKDEIKEFKYKKISEGKEKDFLDELKKQEAFGIAMEEEGVNLYAAFSWKAGEAYFLRLEEELLEKVGKILKQEKTEKVGFDLKGFYKILNKKSLNLVGKTFDVLIGAYLLNAGANITFERLVLEEFGDEIELTVKRKGQLSLVGGENGGDEIFKRNCLLADYSHRLRNVYGKKMAKVSQEQKGRKEIKKTMEDLFWEVEMPLVEVLGQMELNGIKINKVILNEISQKIEKKISNLEVEIHRLAGKEFNINSPGQLSDILFNVLEIPSLDIKKTKTAYSTASAELEKIKNENPIVKKIIKYREVFKLKTTYLDTLPNLVDKKSRLHTSFNQAVTATGRLSSSDPNLQNIPIKSDLGQLMRTAFVAEDGYVLVGADYSQIDLRAVAHVSEDKKLIEAFFRGDDIHRITAAEINDVSVSEVTEKMRSSAKALNFGIIYGMSAFGFSQSAGIDRDKAKEYIDQYFKDFTGVAKYIQGTKEFARANKYVETILGRRRNIAEINSPNFQVQSAAERMAINMPIQGLAADIVKIAMIDIQRHFENDKDVKMVLQIHDEIILEVKKEKAERVAKELKEIMESAYKLRVPLVADVKIGKNWGEI